MYVKVTPNLHTHTHTTHSNLGSFGVGVESPVAVGGEGRRGWERRVKNEVRMKHMFTLDYIESSFY